MQIPAQEIHQRRIHNLVKNPVHHADCVGVGITQPIDETGLDALAGKLRVDCLAAAVDDNRLQSGN